MAREIQTKKQKDYTKSTKYVVPFLYNLGAIENQHNRKKVGCPQTQYKSLTIQLASMLIVLAKVGWD